MNGSKRTRVAVIGSGFGGAIMACRLAESGAFDVAVLERGGGYPRGSFPRGPEALSRAFWQPERSSFGFLEYRSFAHSHIDVLTAAGVGGGSLIYSNVLYRMPEEFFETWPGNIRRATLDPYYDRAVAMLEATPYPVRHRDWPYWQGTPKARALAEVAAKIAASPDGHPKVELAWPPLAVQFGPEPGREMVNQQGVAQTACIMCGECNIGCNTAAKSTLDLNYLARAQRFGATIRPHTEVRAIVPRGASDGGGFDLRLADRRAGSGVGGDRDRDGDGVGDDGERVETFDRVVLAAGSLGSTELVLGMRARTKLPEAAGTRWSPNGDMLGFVLGTEWPLDPSAGPVITGALHVRSARYPDGFAGGAWIEDGGIPGLLAWYQRGRTGTLRSEVGAIAGVVDYLAQVTGLRHGGANVGADLGAVLFGASRSFPANTLLMLGMGRDRATGTMVLGASDAGLELRWAPGAGELHYQRARATMELVARALGGQLVENPLDDVLRRYVSVHPVGGLPLGDDDGKGAVDVRTGELFGCPGLYVVDGSILPDAVGPNPALTIAALAEMYAERMCHA